MGGLVGFCGGVGYLFIYPSLCHIYGIKRTNKFHALSPPWRGGGEGGAWGVVERGVFRRREKVGLGHGAEGLGLGHWFVKNFSYFVNYKIFFFRV